MIYMDNAATSYFKPDSVLSAVAAANLSAANVGRSGHRLSLACLERVFETRKLLCEYFGGYSYDRVVFTKNCTEALSIALLGTLLPGDKVVTTVAEHNSVLRPLHYLKSKGVEVRHVGLDFEGNIDLDELAVAARDCKVAAITLASNVNGRAPEVAEVRKALPAQTLLLCDGAQAAGHSPVDMKGMGIDGLALAGHKGLLGVQGSGVLLFSERMNPKSILFGGTGSESNNLNMPDYYPDALEAGTLNYPAIVSLAEGVIYLQSNQAAMQRSLVRAGEHLHIELSKLPFVRLYSTPNPFGIVAIDIENLPSEVAAYILSERYDICARGGLHCAPLMHRALESSGLLRLSLSSHNTISECDKVVSAIMEIYHDNLKNLNSTDF